MRTLFILVASLLLAIPATAGERVGVFAAASLKNALDQAARTFQADTGHEIVLTYGGTSKLARQIAQGAPADVFLSASVAWMDELAKAGAIDPATRLDWLANRLVVVAHDPREEPLARLQDLPERLGDGRLSTALLRAVPAGIYAREALASAGILETLRPRVAQADNVRVALAFVARGEASHGIVYESDARAEPDLRVVHAVDPTLHQPIVYPAAATAGASEAGRAFLAYLATREGMAPFLAEGFTRPVPPTDG